LISYFPFNNRDTFLSPHKSPQATEWIGWDQIADAISRTPTVLHKYLERSKITSLVLSGNHLVAVRKDSDVCSWKLDKSGSNFDLLEQQIGILQILERVWTHRRFFPAQKWYLPVAALGGYTPLGAVCPTIGPCAANLGSGMSAELS
jgi:hypothetical protein